MKEFLTYTLQATILLTALYCAYKALFARDSFHSAKRMVLIIGIICSLAIPALPITIYTAPEVTATNVRPIITPTVEQISKPIEPTTPSPTITDAPIPITPFDWTLLIFSLYMVGVISLASYQLLGIISALRIARNSTPLMTYRGIKVFTTVRPISPFCFGRKIIISQSEPTDNLEIILSHELSHINHRHELDLLAINALISVMWFNPAVWLLRAEFILLQEYQADKQVIKNSIDAKKYQYLLIARVAPELNLQPVVNQFGASHLHKRITMMKKQSKSIGKLKLLAVIPLLAIAVIACAQTVPTPAAKAISEEFTIPCSGSVMGKFGQQIDPITKNSVFHKGIDIVTDNDTVKSPFSGEVTLCEFDKSGYGNKLTVKHSGGIETTYAHLAKFLVSKGAAVKSGQPIAIVGNTGRTTGKHLHLECRVNGEIVDPAQIFQVTDQNYTLAQLKALLNSRPNARIETYCSNGTIFTQTVDSLTPVTADYIDFSEIYSWEVISGEKLRQIDPNSKVDYLIKFITETPKAKAQNIDLDSVNLTYRVYDHTGKLIKEAFGSRSKIVESIPAGEIASVEWSADKLEHSVVLGKPKGK